MAAPSYIAGTTQDSGGALSLTFTVPAATTTDDFILVFVKQSENTGQQTWDDDGGGGNGYTRIAYNRTTGGRDQETAVYYKFATSGSEANPTFTWHTTTPNEPMSGLMLVYRGVDTVDPYTEITWQWAQNDGNPPNPSVQIDYINTKVVCFHAATHDDISSVGAPTGFTIRDYVYGGSAQHANDHRDCFSADIEVDTTGTYSPPDWTHGVANTTPEYQTYTIALNETQPIHISAPADNSEYVWSSTNVTITGDGFEATQGTGKVEMWSDTAGTTKVTQTIDSWSDTSIQFDFVKGTLTDGTRYLVVTNNTGDVSRKVPLAMGWTDYEPWTPTDADHYWKMNNAYTDEAARGGAKPFNNVQTGTPDFVTTPLLARSNTHSFRINQAVESSEVADSAYTNITNTHSARDIGGWVRIADNQNTPGIIMEEGGGVNNYYFCLNPNGRLMINIADDGDYKAQAYSDFALALNRTYHILLHSHQNNVPKKFELWIDGEKQTSPLAGSLGTKDDMVAHSGDWTFGDADANLDTGGVDIAYAAAYTMYMAHWGTWSNTGGGAPLTDSQIQNDLFRKGAIEEHTISSGTESAMQTSMDAYDSQTHADVPLTYEIAESTSGDFTLDLTDQVWPDEVKFQVRYLGGDTLSLRNSGTSNVVSSKCWAPFGTISVIETAAVDVNVKDLDTSTNQQNARVLVLAEKREAYLTLDAATDELTTPDQAHGSTTIIGLWAKVSMPDWTPAATVIFLEKNATYGPSLGVNTSGQLVTEWQTGATTSILDTSSSAVTHPVDTPVYVGATWRGDTEDSQNAVRYWESDDGITWTQLGAVRYNSGAATLYDQSDGWKVPGNATVTWDIYEAGVLYGDKPNTARVIDRLSDPPTIHLNVADWASGTTFDSRQTGETWTIGGGGTPTQTAGGPLPGEDPVVGITRSGSTATVDHPGHGFTRSDQKVLIAGAAETEYNGVHSITVVDADTYTYTVSGTPATPATRAQRPGSEQVLYLDSATESVDQNAAGSHDDLDAISVWVRMDFYWAWDLGPTQYMTAWSRLSSDSHIRVYDGRKVNVGLDLNGGDEVMLVGFIPSSVADYGTLTLGFIADLTKSSNQVTAWYKEDGGSWLQFGGGGWSGVKALDNNSAINEWGTTTRDIVFRQGAVIYDLDLDATPTYYADVEEWTTGSNWTGSDGNQWDLAGGAGPPYWEDVQPITATAVIIDGLTDASGNISGEIDYVAPQPIIGRVRKAPSAGTKYKTAGIASTVGAGGYDQTTFLIKDE